MEHEYILKYIRTSDERNELINLIEELMENNFKKTPDPIDQTPFSQKASEVIYGEIGRIGISQDREKIEKFFEKLLNDVKELPEIRISIAIRPTEKLMNKLKEWAMLNNFQNAVFNIEVRQDVVAGAVVMSPEGEYKNFSIANDMNAYFTNKKREILALL